MQLKIYLDDALADALMRDARSKLRYPDQQVEAILREALQVPLPSMAEALRARQAERAVSEKEAVHA